MPSLCAYQDQMWEMETIMDRVHLKAPGNWINDPNGFIFYKGNYHLFYQYFPYSPRWGTMHWGHAVSRDLVNWEHQGVALFPTKYEDQNGCFSGSAIEKDGRLYLYYTGVHYHKSNPEDIHRCLNDEFESCQMLITSEDGFHFDNFNGKRVVIPVITDGKIGDKVHTRDPKVWRGKDGFYIVLGSRTPEDKGKLIFYKSRDLFNWEMVNSALKERGFGWMWECPDYFETRGGKVLIISPMGIGREEEPEKNQTICMQVEFDEETCRMEIPEHFQYLDYGLDLYAPQSTLDEEGRRVLVAWLRMPEAVEGKWNGMFCIPRVAEVEKGHIYFKVHPNIEKLYTRKIAHAAEADSAGYRVSFALDEGETAVIGGYKISRKGNRICTDRTGVFPKGPGSRMQSATPEVKEGFWLDVYVDANLIEVYVNQGEYVISHAVYGLTDEIYISPEKELQIYTLEKQEQQI